MVGQGVGRCGRWPRPSYMVSDGAKLFGALILVAMTLKRNRWANMVAVQRMRNDAAGKGHFGAPRGMRLHQGLDLEVEPGEPVFSPVDGRFIRAGYPYANDRTYRLAVLNGEGYEVKAMYVDPDPSLRPGDPVRKGQRIGTAQDVAAKYGGPMKPHVHVEVRKIVGAHLMDPAKFLKLLG